MKAFAQFIMSIWHHWLVLISGGVVIVLLGVYERWLGSSVPWLWYVAIIMIFLLSSCFLAWRDEYVWRVKLEDQARPKLTIEFKGSSQRPEMQDLEQVQPYGADQRLFRVAIINTNSRSIAGARLELESVESDNREKFFPGHALRVMGSRDTSPRFDIAAGATQWVDLVGCYFDSSGKRHYYVPYAELGEQFIPSGVHILLLRADGGGLPTRVRVVAKCPESGSFEVGEFTVLK